MKLNKTIKTILPLAAFAGLAFSANAATVSYVGVQYDFEDKAQLDAGGWRNPATAKTYDADNVFGTDGYQIFNASTALPDYVSSVARLSSGSNTKQGYMDNPSDPTGTDTTRYGVWYEGGVGEFDLFSFTLDNSGGDLDGLATIRISVFQDTNATAWTATVGQFAQIYRLEGPGATTASSVSIGAVEPNDLDAVVFDITGFADGDVYTLYSTATGTSGHYKHAVGCSATTRSPL